MSTSLIAKAFEQGVKAALKFFQGSGGHKSAAKSAETVMRNMEKAVRAAKKVRK